MNPDIVLAGEQLYPANDVHVTCKSVSRHTTGQVQKIHWYVICFGLLKMSLKLCYIYQNKCPRNYGSHLIYVSDVILSVSKLDYFGFNQVIKYGCRITPVG